MFAESTIKEYNDLLASKRPVPGGGSALASIGATACALAEMTVNIAAAKSKDETKTFLLRQRELLLRARNALYRLSDEDAQAFEKLTAQLTAAKRGDASNKLQIAYHCAALVPLDVMQLCCETLKVLQTRVAMYLSKSTVVDCEIACQLLKTVVQCSAKNVFANVAHLNDEQLRATLTGRCKMLLDEAAQSH